MKFIQTLISDGMSMNSLKPSINSEAESSLDSCIMKETPVDDCILSKELHSQNNGEKELCLKEYDIGGVENTTKKMFEQVDLNSSMPSSEVPLKKDSWDSGALCDNSSEKENMEMNEVRYDILSDDDDNESIHLKISSDDENSALESETNDQNSTCNKQLENNIDDISRDVPEDGENTDSRCEELNELQNESNYNEFSEEEMPSNCIPEKDASLDGYEIEGKLIIGGSDHEDAIEDFESMACSESPPLKKVNDSITLDSRNKGETISDSCEASPNAEKDSDILEANLENDKQENKIETDTNLLANDIQNEFKQDSSPKQMSTEDSVMKDVSHDTSGEAELLTENNENHFSSVSNENRLSSVSDENQLNSSVSDENQLSSSVNDKNQLSSVDDKINSVEQESEKQDHFLLDNVNDSDSCIENSQENSFKINDIQETGEDSSNECVEEEDIPSRTVDVDSEPKDGSPETSEFDPVKEGPLIIERSPLQDLKLLEGESPLKESTDSEEKFLEILEYQPMNEEGEELRETQLDKEMSEYQPMNEEGEELQETRLDKEMSGDEVQPKTSSDDNEEQLEPSELDIDRDFEGNDSPSSVPKDSNCSSPKFDAETSPFDSPKTNSAEAEITNHSKDVKEQDCDVKECDNNDKVDSVERDLPSLVQSGNKLCETNKTLDNAGDVRDIECVSVIVSTKKQESLSQNFEVQSGRKRSSSNEENLVSCSKRTKVAVSESEENESDVIMSEQPTDSVHRKKCTEVDTKEKCDSRTKRLSNSIGDAVEMKKIRVMPEVSNSDKDTKVDKEDNSSGNLEIGKSNEKNTDSRKESSSLARHPMPFLRTLNNTQFQNLSRNDLEELLLQKMCEAVTQRSRCGEMRELAQSLEEKLKSWQKKCLQLTKQVKDLNLVLKRYGSDLQSKGAGAIPVRITRSVGLQVQMPGISNTNWNSEDSGTKRKPEKTPPPVSTSSASSPVANSPKVSSPVAKPTASNVQKVSDGSDVQGSTTAARHNSQSSSQASGVKALQTKSPGSSNPAPTSTSKSSNKSQPPSVNNRVKSSDLQVIDLTDGEDKTKTNTSRVPAVTTVPSTTSASVPNASTTVTSPITNTPVTTVGIPVTRSIRVVQQFGGSSTPILAQSGTNAVAGQRVAAYFVPSSTAVPVQPRQLIISSPSPVRPAGVVSMSQRQNPLPTIVLKPGQVVPVSPVTAGGNIIRTSSIGSSLQLTSRTQPRTGQLIQRIPVNATPVQSSGLSVAQSSGLTVSSVSHPAPLPAVPTGPSNANWKLPPPKPDLKISKVPNRNQQGIVLSWNMTVSNEHEQIASYQLFAYQEGNAPPSTHLWKKVGDVTALPLPMACTLTQFMEGHKYHFAVRAVDVFARCGPFSAPGNIVLSRH